ncbi:MAG TPA: sugar ABC transporter permease [Micrococcaceae bacterium]|nr:sugar ABC transporter permease [Micrococcaceae bacterium]
MSSVSTAAAPETISGGPGNQKQAMSRAAAWARRAPLLPALIFVIVTTQLPFAVTLFVSFFNWNSLRPNDRGFAGVSNYVQVFADPDLRHSVWVTVLLTASVVLLSLAIGLAIALLLNQKFLGRGVVRTLLIAPFLVVPVAAALFWKHAVLNPAYGLINGLLTGLWNMFGAEYPPQLDLLTDQPLAAIIISLVWQWTPFMMLILLAGLQSRPADAIEAAHMDGANAWQVFRYITLPHLRQYLELGGLLGAIYIVQNFDAVFTLTSGGLGTSNLPYAVYKTFYIANEYGVASAAGVVTVAGSLIVATFALRSVFSIFKKEAAR